MAKIGFIGLGNMGVPMAANLVRGGHSVRGFDLVPAALEGAKGAGVAIASSAIDAATGADAVITMLPSGRHVLEVYRSGLMKSAAPATLFLDCSTIDVSSAREAHEIARAAGMDPVDAPVSGGVAGATKGTLTFMCGGEAESVERATPILAAMGKKIVHCGIAGTGQAAKICNNMILGISMIAVSEAFLLGEGLGLSAQAFFDVVSTSSGQCWAVTTNCPVPGLVPASPANNQYKPGFSAKLMHKDLELAREAAQSTGITTLLGGQAADSFAAYEDAGFGGTDFSGIINYLRGQTKKDA